MWKIDIAVSKRGALNHTIRSRVAATADLQRTTFNSDKCIHFSNRIKHKASKVLSRFDNPVKNFWEKQQMN